MNGFVGGIVEMGLPGVFHVVSLSDLRTVIAGIISIAGTGLQSLMNKTATLNADPAIDLKRETYRDTDKG